MSKNLRCLPAFLLISTLFSFSGCGNGPRFFQPSGTIGYQRSQAVLHDPFPSNDLGPTIMGGRPREFDRPLPEVVDSQQSPWAQQGSPIPAGVGF